MNSFKDLIDDIDKMVRKPIVGVLTTTTVGFTIGYFVYQLSRLDYVHDTGSIPRKDIVEYRQRRALKGIKRKRSYKRNVSEDSSRQVVTQGFSGIPRSIESESYNCWSWAINPINGVLTSCDPFDGILTPLSIDVMRKATKEYLSAMKKRKKIMKYFETQDQGTVLEFMQQKSIRRESKLIIGLRVMWDTPYFDNGSDYHYIRWYFGQWSAKCGCKGILVKSAGHETYSIEPETMWAATRQRPNEPGSVYLRWKEDNQIHREVIYKGPTIYYLITLN